MQEVMKETLANFIERYGKTREERERRRTKPAFIFMAQVS